MNDKIIVTNRKALVEKYGKKEFTMIRKMLKILQNADQKRGIKSRVVYLDYDTHMKKTGCKPVKNFSDPSENKDAIDAIFKHYSPHYLMILGATDVVPQQDLKNPLFPAGDDEDEFAFSDLPYACDVPYSQDASEFIGPTRVVGRLPDLTGAREPSFVVSLLKTVAGHKTRPGSDYKSHFGLSADVWQKSTRLSLNNIFGNGNQLLRTPPSGPKYPKGQLRNRMHFINCHGAIATPEFYGEKNKKKPVSLTYESTKGQIVEGTVAAVECCYGAELYNSIELTKDPPICQSYLQQRAYGYFGSTTISYGPSDENGAADLICQYFLQHVLKGESIGHATLMARQQYVENVSEMDAADLKTLSQFYLLGDPSVHPITQPKATKIPSDVTGAEAERFFRTERRQKMKSTGNFLIRTKATASRKERTGKLSPTIENKLLKICKLEGLSKRQKFTAFRVENGLTTSSGLMAKDRKISLRYLITVGTPVRKVHEKVKRAVAIVAKELNGRIYGYRIYYQR